MTAFVLRRLAGMIGTVLALIAIEFTLQTLSPVNPARVLVGPTAPESALVAAEHRLYLDRPLYLQYFHYIVGVLHGNLSISVRTGDPIASDLSNVLPPTVELIAVAIVLSLLLAVVLGVVSASYWPGSGVLRVVMLAFASMPPFLLALLCILVVANKLGWLPGTGQTSYSGAPTGPTGLLLVDAVVHGDGGVFLDALRHLVMPAVCVSLISAVSIGKILRSSLIDNLGADYCRTALSKGLSRREVLLGHALRNSVAGLSIAGVQLGIMFASVVVVEQIFAWPGLGSYLARASPRMTTRPSPQSRCFSGWVMWQRTRSRDPPGIC